VYEKKKMKEKSLFSQLFLCAPFTLCFVCLNKIATVCSTRKGMAYFKSFFSAIFPFIGRVLLRFFGIFQEFHLEMKFLRIIKTPKTTGISSKFRRTPKNA
jgi:hypothetical protein